jgi:hypothetical protein
MNITVEQRAQAARMSVAAADEWRRKDEVPQQLACLVTALTAHLSVAVSGYDTSESGREYLGTAGVGHLVLRVLDLNNRLLLALQEHRRPTIGTVSALITPVHVAWMIDEWEAGARLLAIGADPLVRKYAPLTPFWAEYHRALEALAACRPYVPELGKLRGYESYWAAYLPFIRDLTHSNGGGLSLHALRAAFAKRNQDRRLTDFEMIDGDAGFPVRWDFREVSITRYWRRGERAPGRQTCAAEGPV